MFMDSFLLGLFPAPVLVIAPHPDDETLGVGGTLKQLSDAGVETHVLFVTDGTAGYFTDGKAHPGYAAAWARRQAELRQAQTILGFAAHGPLDLPDNRLDTLGQEVLIRALEQVIAQLKPATVLVPHPLDSNQDHRAVWQAAQVACRPQLSSPVQAFYSYQIPGSGQWHWGPQGTPPNVYVALTPEEIEAKHSALRAYAGELKPDPHPRSPTLVVDHNYWLGAAVGHTAAEAFWLHFRRPPDSSKDWQQ
jgi:LmbE family N-acetylglucosaminyl deacetylase